MPGPNPTAWQLGSRPPWVAVNTGAVDQVMPAEGDGVAFLWRQGAMIVHPGDHGLVVVRWVAPAGSTASVDYAFTHVNSGCGNGIRWFIDQGNQRLAGGVVGQGERTGLQVLQTDIRMGQHLDFIVDSNGPYGCDWTELEAVVRLNSKD